MSYVIPTYSASTLALIAKKDPKAFEIIAAKSKPGAKVYYANIFVTAPVWATTHSLTDEAAILAAPRVRGKINILHTEKDAPIIIKKGCQDIEDPKNLKRESITAQRPAHDAVFNLSIDSSGNLGQFFANFGDIWAEGVKKLVESKDFLKKDTLTVIKTHYSDKKEIPAEFNGKPRPSPIYLVNVDFAKMSDKHPDPSCRGKPKTIIYDGERPIIHEIVSQSGEKLKRYSYPEYVFKGSPVDVHNVHEVLTWGVQIIKGTFVTEPNSSQQGNSCKIYATSLVIKGKAAAVQEEGFEDENGNIIPASAVKIVKSATNTEVKTETVPADIPAESKTETKTELKAEISEDTVEDLLK